MSQFSAQAHEPAGIFIKDKNARAKTAMGNNNIYFRAFLALLNKHNCDALQGQNSFRSTLVV